MIKAREYSLATARAFASDSLNTRFFAGSPGLRDSSMFGDADRKLSPSRCSSALRKGELEPNIREVPTDSPDFISNKGKACVNLNPKPEVLGFDYMIPTTHGWVCKYTPLPTARCDRVKRRYYTGSHRWATPGCLPSISVYSAVVRFVDEPG